MGFNPAKQATFSHRHRGLLEQHAGFLSWRAAPSQGEPHSLHAELAELRAAVK